ncbi:alkylated DNA repair protein alkB like protein 6 [Trypanosoma theileri]|uniref:Alkylated DNA repair protein alkB like protein 6 n=1 Tax=Trypanosoma theileri TaxID=67003 RepID=A0A1X0P422_9TRYP|nr:alkylated DNA repair protein alkB like protein 6 [Trypanosoma theileri]ORC91319.1 alkylated DNA repair protein alkB like protein 6 [Trypanosoma theileri]
MRRCPLLPRSLISRYRALLGVSTISAIRHQSSGVKSTVGETMKASGFQLSTPNFSIDHANEMESTAESDLVNDLITTPVTSVDFVRDLYGPWLVLTEALQGELFIDHDRMVYFRPANGLGFGVGRIHILNEENNNNNNNNNNKTSSLAGVIFTLQLESYTYPVTSSMPPYAPVKMEVTGVVNRVRSTSNEYSTFSLVGTWRGKDDSESGKFNAAKLSPWDPTMSAKPWEPNGELLQVFQQVFPKELKLTSHVKRSQALQETIHKNNDNNKNNNNNNNNNTFGNININLNKPLPLHMSLDQYRVGDVSDVHYIPNYISEEEEKQMLEFVQNTPKELKSQLTKRTAQEWGCSMCEECNKSFVSDRNMPPWVERYTDMLLHDGIYTPSSFPNSVRIHEYQVGEGIAPHCDGPIYFPLVSVLSLNSPCVMFFYPRREPHAQPMEHYNDTFRFDGDIPAERPIQCVVMEPRSLLLFRGDAYYYYPHGTSDRAVDSLAPEVAGTVVNRHLLQDKNITEVKKGYRVSITTRNLLPRCNHQPSRAEYCMKRAWYVYNHLPEPEPLITPPPVMMKTTPSSLKSSSSSSTVEETKKAEPVMTMSNTAMNGGLIQLEKKINELLTQQNSLAQQVNELRQFMAGDVTFRKEVSTVLSHLSSTVLDIDSKLDDMIQERNNGKGKESSSSSK